MVGEYTHFPGLCRNVDLYAVYQISFSEPQVVMEAQWRNPAITYTSVDL